MLLLNHELVAICHGRRTRLEFRWGGSLKMKWCWALTPMQSTRREHGTNDLRFADEVRTMAGAEHMTAIRFHLYMSHFCTKMRLKGI